MNYFFMGTDNFSGQSLPLERYRSPKCFSLHYICYNFTVYPHDDKITEYLNTISKTILRKGKDQLWVSGRKINSKTQKSTLAGVKYFHTPEAFLKEL